MKCAGILVLVCLSLGSLSGQVAPSLGPTMVPADPAAPSPTPYSMGDDLSSISDELMATANDLEALLSTLDELLVEAGVSQTALDYSLAESMQSAQNGLDSIKDSMKLYRATRLELWLWRGATALGIIGTVGMGIWGLTR